MKAPAILTHFIIAGLLSLATALHAAPRLALIGNGQGLGPAIDLMTVALSGHDGVELLERSELERVYREQALGAGKQDWVKLGRVLGADGVMIVEKGTEGTNAVLGVRLVAVKPGVVLAQRSYPWPLDSATGWTERVRAQFEPLFPKLGVLEKDAVPVSVLNLRSAVKSRDGEALERDLTTLLERRLSHQREVFVLERRRMTTLEGEKDLASETNAFWSGSYLIEGTIDPDGYDAATARVTLRLSRKGDSARELRIEGARSNVIALAEVLVGGILEAIRGRKTEVAGWDAAAEAQRYYEEAKWAEKWRLWEQAREASDSAWALGIRSIECAVIRIQSRNVFLLHRPIISYSGSGLLPRNREVLDQIQKPAAMGLVVHIDSEQFQWVYLPGKPEPMYVPPIMPDPQFLDPALEVLSMYWDISRSIQPSPPAIGTSWEALGANVLETVARVLTDFHTVPRSYALHAEKLASLRALCRSASDYLSGSEVTSEVSEGAGSAALKIKVGPPLPTKSLDPQVPNIFPVKLRVGFLWQERPEDAITMYRDLMKSPVYPHYHAGMSRRFANHPYLPSWSGAQWNVLNSMWQGYIAELKRSTNAFLGFEGRCLEWESMREIPDAEQRFDEVLLFLRQNRDQFLKTPFKIIEKMGTSRIRDVLIPKATPSRVRDLLEGRYRQEVLPEIQGMARAHYPLVQAAEEHARKEAERTANGRLFISYLENFEPFDMIVMAKLNAFLNGPVPAAQLERLVPAFEAYSARYTAQDAATRQPPLTSMQAQQLASVEMALKKPAGLPVVAAKPVPQPRLTSTNLANPTLAFVPNTASSPAPSPQQLGRLEFRKFSTIPLNLIPTAGGARDEFGELNFSNRNHRVRFELVSDGKVWSEVKYTVNSYRGSQTKGNFVGVAGGVLNGVPASAFVSWDPSSGQWAHHSHPSNSKQQQLIQSYGKAAPEGYHAWFAQDTRFAMHNGFIYTSGPGKLIRFSPVSHASEVLSIIPGAAVQFVEVGGRLYAWSREAIHEITDDLKSTKTLASIRRRPALTELDSLPEFRDAVLFQGAGGRLGVAFSNSLYHWDGTAWQRELSFTSGWVTTGSRGMVLATIESEMPVLPGGGPAGGVVKLLMPSGKNSSLDLCWMDAVATSKPSPPGMNLANLKHAPAVALQSAAADQSTSRESTKWPNPGNTNLGIGRESTLYSDGTNLFAINWVGVKQWTRGPLIADVGGRHADLVVFDQQSRSHFVIPLWFDLESVQRENQAKANPVAGSSSVPGRPVPWADFVGDYLVLGGANMSGYWSVKASDLYKAMEIHRTAAPPSTPAPR